MDNKSHGDHLAIAATLRILARHIAKVESPNDASGWFLAVGQETFDYVDHTSNPAFNESQIKPIKEAAYATLRMIFDPTGF